MLTMSKIGLRSSVSAGLIWLCSACSPLLMLNSVIPENGYQHFADISYGEESRQILDIYLSNRSNPDAVRKTVVFFMVVVGTLAIKKIINLLPRH